MNVLYWFGIGFASLYALWVFFLAVMGLKLAREAGRLTVVAKCLGYPVLLVGYALDIFVNVTVMTILLVELPHEFVVTDRVTRHLNTSLGFRHTISEWFCKNLLDPFDPSGCHCKKAQ